MRKHGVQPAEKFDLSALEGITLSGSPATPETFAWFYEQVKADLWVTSQSGGTEFCSGLVVGVPTLPVHAGEIQARALGADVRVFNDAGEERFDEVGELVVLKPMPSMPIGFWGDADFAKYREAYFDVFPDVWRHGDFMTINERGGCYIYGRSDSTLNRFGVRIGTAEIYRALEAVPEVLDSLAVCIEEPGGGFFMPLFVQAREPLDATLIGRINTALRVQCSPRHVPDVILAAPSIPYTLTGKRMEVPVRKLLMGWPAERAFNRGSMQNGAAMDWYLDFADKRREVVTPMAVR
jgi:acetoacetyl-CoA synthetase